jgi:bifunctional enzyme CysN/CysC/sulfate adenylyltransferase subunit 1
VVCINKLDLVGFDRLIFERLSAEVRAFAGRLGFAQLQIIPVSARGGDNVAVRSPRTPWHQGGTVLDFLESVPAARTDADRPLRFPVQSVIRAGPDYRGYAGRITSGTVRVGDEVVILPSGTRSRVRAIDTFEGELASAQAPLSVTLRLTDAVDVSRGDLIAAADAAPPVRTLLEATAVWLSERPLDPGRAYLLKHTTRLVPARVEAVRWRLDPETLQRQDAERLELNELGRIVVRCARPIAGDDYAKDRATGAFILIDALTNDTVAAGTLVAGEADRAALDRERGGAVAIRAEERRARLGHAGAVLVVEDEQLAPGLERALFERGCATAGVRSAAAAIACAEAGLVAVCATTGSDLDRARLLSDLRASGLALVELRGDERAAFARLQELAGIP